MPGRPYERRSWISEGSVHMGKRLKDSVMRMRAIVK